jgi:hypothetical protein
MLKKKYCNIFEKCWNIFNLYEVGRWKKNKKHHLDRL